MTEQQLREKLQFAYGTMPDATRAAFEHSLTHHRAPETHRSIGLSRMMRIVITAVLMALMLPDLGGTFDGEKYAAEGILLDENGQMPPEGKPIAWTIEIDVLKAVWQTETMPDDLYEALSEEDDVAQYIREQAEQHVITLTDAGVEDYLLEMCGAGWDEIEQMSKADLLLRCGGFERAETYTVAFATEGNTQYVHSELSACGFRWTGTRRLWTMCAHRSSAGAWCCTAKRRMERHCRMGRHCRTCGESTATTSRIRRVKRDGRARRAMRACRAAWRT